MDVVAIQRPDTVLVDINMPVMDGIEATRRLRQLYPQLHCIALSVFDEDAIIIEMLDAGACGYLMKTRPRGRLSKLLSRCITNTPIIAGRRR
jgi:DNA-binding NarL/FixJ family response regulator